MHKWICHLSVKIDHFSDNLPRCQALLADQLSLITWRGIIFLFRNTRSSSICLSFLQLASIYAIKKPHFSSRSRSRFQRSKRGACLQMCQFYLISWCKTQTVLFMNCAKIDELRCNAILCLSDFLQKSSQRLSEANRGQDI
jgi:hypothetical protein